MPIADAAARGIPEPMIDAGDPFDALFRRHWPRVYGVLFRVTGAREEAEDLAIEVFLRLHGRPPRVEKDGDLEGWLYRVAMRLGLNALRARKRRLRRHEEAAREMSAIAALVPQPAHDLERDETRVRVRRVLAGLKPRAAALLVLRHSGLSYAEVARALELAPGSVGTLLARAEREFAQRYRALEGES